MLFLSKREKRSLVQAKGGRSTLSRRYLGDGQSGQQARKCEPNKDDGAGLKKGKNSSPTGPLGWERPKLLVKARLDLRAANMREALTEEAY